MIKQYLENANSVAILGHVNPDGDCVGSTMALYLYLKKKFCEKKIHIYLDECDESLKVIKHMDAIRHYDSETIYDCVFVLDVSDKKRIGAGKNIFENAKKTVNIDHHISNPKFCDETILDPECSSACELLYRVLEKKDITKEIAKSLYLGMVHDTGVFQYSNVTKETMTIAGELISYGFDFTKLVQQSFYEKTYHQMQMLGRTLVESVRVMDGRCIFSVVTQEMMHFYKVNNKALSGVVENLRNVAGVEVAILIYEMEACQYKVSLRSTKFVDVNIVANVFGGGGHMKAAGCIMQGTSHDVINNLTREIERQYDVANK